MHDSIIRSNEAFHAVMDDAHASGRRRAKKYQPQGWRLAEQALDGYKQKYGDRRFFSEGHGGNFLDVTYIVRANYTLGFTMCAEARLMNMRFVRIGSVESLESLETAL